MTSFVASTLQDFVGPSLTLRSDGQLVRLPSHTAPLQPGQLAVRYIFSYTSPGDGRRRFLVPEHRNMQHQHLQAMTRLVGMPADPASVLASSRLDEFSWQRHPSASVFLASSAQRTIMLPGRDLVVNVYRAGPPPQTNLPGVMSVRGMFLVPGDDSGSSSSSDTDCFASFPTGGVTQANAPIDGKILLHSKCRLGFLLPDGGRAEVRMADSADGVAGTSLSREHLSGTVFDTTCVVSLRDDSIASLLAEGLRSQGIKAPFITGPAERSAARGGAVSTAVVAFLGGVVVGMGASIMVHVTAYLL